MVSAVGAGVVLVVRVVVGAGVLLLVVGAVLVLVAAGVGVVDGASIDHEAVKPFKAVERSDVNSTRKTPIFDVYVLHRVLGGKTCVSPTLVMPLKSCIP